MEMLTEWSKTTPILQTPAKYPLRHLDLSVNNIFIDEENRITCLNDWEFVSTVPVGLL